MGCVALLLVASASCNGRQSPPPLARLERILSVSFPDNATVIGGSEASEAAALWLIVSSEPLALPKDIESSTSRSSVREDRPAGTEFPISALLNLMAACRVAEEKLPNFTADRGVSHQGNVGSWQFIYREAPTEKGWLTAVEVQTTNPPSSSRAVQ
jgi:hypothetical protein